jgi:hypothetical protein
MEPGRDAGGHRDVSHHEKAGAKKAPKKAAAGKKTAKK